MDDKFDGALVSYNEKTHPDGSTPGRSFAFALSHVQFIKPEYRPLLTETIQSLQLLEKQKAMLIELTLRLFFLVVLLYMFDQAL